MKNTCHVQIYDMNMNQTLSFTDQSCLSPSINNRSFKINHQLLNQFLLPPTMKSTNKRKDRAKVKSHHSHHSVAKGRDGQHEAKGGGGGQESLFSSLKRGILGLSIRSFAFSSMFLFLGLFLLRVGRVWGGMEMGPSNLIPYLTMTDTEDDMETKASYIETDIHNQISST